MRYLLLLLLSLSINIFSNELHTQDVVKQGEPITSFIYPLKGNYNFKFHLYSGDKIITSYSGFNYYFPEEDVPLILGLGGIPSNLKPGVYRIVAEGKGFLELITYERKIRVIDGGYETREIQANPKMDSIAYGERDELRDEQAKRWWDTITYFNPYSDYHSGRLVLPVADGRRSSPFGYKREFKYPSGKRSSTIHNGEDFAKDLGTPVFSDSSGIVRLSEERIVTGNTVIVEHLPGVFTLYYHLNERVVEEGERIDTRDLIGYVGSTGFSTGPHLHWEVRFSTIPVNPNYFLERPLIDKTLIMNIINSTNSKKGG